MAHKRREKKIYSFKDTLAAEENVKKMGNNERKDGVGNIHLYFDGGGTSLP